MIHRFGLFELDEPNFVLRCKGEPIVLQRRALETLLLLVKSQQRLVTKDDLLKGPWNGVVVTDGAMAQVIMLVRKALGDANHEVIKTVPGKGYCFVAEVVSNEPGVVSAGTLPSKVREPRAGWTYSRERLFRLLDESRKAPLVWVVGPPGAGKTTLVHSYLEERQLPRLWYRIDEQDHDLAAFLQHSRNAADHLTNPVKAPLPAFSGEYLAGLLVFARKYFEALFAALPEGSALVVDDYHLLSPESDWHHMLRQAISTVPTGSTIIVASRTKPPAILARERANGQIAIIDWDNLQLSRDEAQAIVQGRGLETTPDVVDRLHQLSGGWAAGLVLLLARAKMHQDQPEALVATASQELFDYFALEAFQNLEPATQQFLLRSAVVSTMTSSLARELTGHSGADDLLVHLHRTNFFTTAHGESGRTYEFHPLFRAFLQDRARRTFDAAQLSELKVTAGSLLASSGDCGQAIELFLDVQRFDRAAECLVRAAPDLYSQGRAATIQAWLGRFPDNIVETNGWLLYWKAHCRLGQHPAESLLLLTRGFALMRAARDPHGTYLSWAGIVFAAIYAGDDFYCLEKWLDVFDQLACEVGGFPSVEIESIVTTARLHTIFSIDPARKGSRACAARALDLSRRVGPAGQGFATAALNVLFHAHFGDLHEATAVMVALRRARQRFPDPIAQLSLRLAEVSYAWVVGERERSLAEACDALDLARETGVGILTDYFLGLALTAALALEDRERASELLRALGERAHQNQYCKTQHLYYVAWDAVVRGDLNLAETSFATAVRACFRLGFPLARMVALFGQAVLYDRLGKRVEAFSALREVTELAKRFGSRLFERGCLLLSAHLAFQEADEASGARDLAEGLAIGREEGPLNMVCFPDDILAGLCRNAIDLGIEIDHVRTIMAKFRLAGV